VQPPEGFVSRDELERVEAQRKGFQSENDRLKAELAAARAPAAPTATSGTPEGFDPQAFETQLLGKVLGATALSTEAVKLQAEFPHADPSLFTAEKLAQFGSPEALRAAAEADHTRIANAVAAAKAEAEAAATAALAGAGSPLGPIAPPTPGADPTVDQLAALRPSELAEYEAANPGVIDRVMKTAMAAG
jgi:hypothetical protein